MALVSDTRTLAYHPMSELLLKTILSALTVLVAFSLRDTVTTGIAVFVPADLLKKFLFTLLISLIFLFVTVFLAWWFQDHVEVNGES